MFDHLVKIDADSKLIIYRIYEDGRQELFTSIEIPKKDNEEFDKDLFSTIAKRLGEDILIDSPKGRKAFKI